MIILMILIIIILIIIIYDNKSNNNITINSDIKILLKVNHKIFCLYKLYFVLKIFCLSFSCLRGWFF